MSTLQMGQQFSSYDEFMSTLLAFQEASRHRFIKHYQKTVQWATQNNVCPPPQPRLRYFRLKMNCSRKESKAAGGDCGTWIRLGVTKDGERLEVVAMDLKECGPPAPSNNSHQNQNSVSSQPPPGHPQPATPGQPLAQTQIGCDATGSGAPPAQSPQMTPIMASIHPQQQMYYDQGQSIYQPMEHPPSYQPSGGGVQYTELQTTGYVPVTNQQLAQATTGGPQDPQNLQGLPPLPSFGHLGGFQQPVQAVQSITVQHGYQSEATTATGPQQGQQQPPAPPPQPSGQQQQVHHQQYATSGPPPEHMYSSHPQGGYQQMEYHPPISYHPAPQHQQNPQHTTAILQPLYSVPSQQHPPPQHSQQQQMSIPTLPAGHHPQPDVSSTPQNQQSSQSGLPQQHHLAQQVNVPGPQAPTSVVVGQQQESGPVAANTPFGSEQQRQQVYSQHQAGPPPPQHTQQVSVVQQVVPYVGDYGQIATDVITRGHAHGAPPSSQPPHTSQPHYQEMQPLTVGQASQVIELNSRSSSMSQPPLTPHSVVQITASQQQQGYPSSLVEIDSCGSDQGLLYADLSQPQLSYQHVATRQHSAVHNALDGSSDNQQGATTTGSNQMQIGSLATVTPTTTTNANRKKKSKACSLQQQQTQQLPATEPTSSLQKATTPGTIRASVNDSHHQNNSNRQVVHLKDLTSKVPALKAGPRNTSTLEALLGNSGPRGTSGSSVGASARNSAHSKAESEGSVAGGVPTGTNRIQTNSTRSTSLELRNSGGTEAVPHLHLGQTYCSYKLAEQAVENYASPKGFKFRKIGSMLLKRIEGKEKLKEQFANATADPGIKYFALKFRCVRSRQLTMVSNYVKKKKDDDGHTIQESPIPMDTNQNNNDSTSNSSKVPMGSCSARITFQLNARGTGLEVKQLDESHDHPPDDELREKFTQGIARTSLTGALNKLARPPVKGVKRSTTALLSGVTLPKIVPVIGADSVGGGGCRTAHPGSDHSHDSRQKGGSGGGGCLNLPLDDSFLNEHLVSEQLQMMNGDEEAEPEVDLLSNIQSLAEEIDKLSETDGLPADLASLDAALKHDDLGGLGLGGHLGVEGPHTLDKGQGHSLKGHKISSCDNNNVVSKNTSVLVSSGERTFQLGRSGGPEPGQGTAQAVRAENIKRESEGETVECHFKTNGHYRELTEEQVVPKDQANRTTSLADATDGVTTNTSQVNSEAIKVEGEEGGKVVPEVNIEIDVSLKETLQESQNNLADLKVNGSVLCSWTKAAKGEPLEQDETKEEKYVKMEKDADRFADGDADSVMVNCSSSMKSGSALDEDMKDEVHKGSPNNDNLFNVGVAEEMGSDIPRTNSPSEDDCKTKRIFAREVKKLEINVCENVVTSDVVFALKKKALKVGAFQEDLSSSVISPGTTDTFEGTNPQKMSIQDGSDPSSSIDDDSSKEKAYGSSNMGEAAIELVLPKNKINDLLIRDAHKEASLTDNNSSNNNNNTSNHRSVEHPVRGTNRSRTALIHTPAGDESESEGSVYLPPAGSNCYIEYGARTGRRTSRMRTRGKRTRGESGGSLVGAHERFNKIARSGQVPQGAWEGRDELRGPKRTVEETLRARHVELRGCKVLVQMADLPKDFEVYWSEEDVQRQLEEAERDEANETLKQLAQMLASNEGEILTQRKQLLTSLLYHWKAEKHVSLLASYAPSAKVRNIFCINSSNTDPRSSLDNVSSVGYVDGTAATCQQQLQLQRQDTTAGIKASSITTIETGTSSPSAETSDTTAVKD